MACPVLAVMVVHEPVGLLDRSAHCSLRRDALGHRSNAPGGPLGGIVGCSSRVEEVHERGTR